MSEQHIIKQANPCVDPECIFCGGRDETECPAFIPEKED